MRVLNPRSGAAEGQCRKQTWTTDPLPTIKTITEGEKAKVTGTSPPSGSSRRGITGVCYEPPTRNCNGDQIYTRPGSQSLSGESSQTNDISRVSGMLFDERGSKELIRKELGKAEKGQCSLFCLLQAQGEILAQKATWRSVEEDSRY